MELKDRAALYFVLCIPLSIMYDGYIIIIFLWLHFFWCIYEQKEMHKYQEKMLLEDIISGKYYPGDDFMRKHYTEEQRKWIMKEKAKRIEKENA